MSKCMKDGEFMLLMNLVTAVSCKSGQIFFPVITITFNVRPLNVRPFNVRPLFSCFIGDCKRQVKMYSIIVEI